MKKLLSIITLLLAVCSGAWATDVSIAWDQFKALPAVGGMAKITATTAANGEGSSLYANSSIQIAASGTGYITVKSTVDGYYIKSISFTDSKKKISTVTCAQAQAGETSEYTSSTGAYSYVPGTGRNLTSVDFTVVAQSSQVQIKVFSVVLTTSASDPLEKLTFTTITNNVVGYTNSAGESALSSLSSNITSGSTGRIQVKKDRYITISSETNNIKAIAVRSYQDAALDFSSADHGTFSNTDFVWTPDAGKYKSITLNGPTGSNTFNITDVYVVLEASRTATSETLKSSAAVKVDGTALTKDAATNGYSVSTNTITLSNDIQYASTPSDIKLVKTITYSEGDPDEADVDVDFDGTVEEGYYIGTASIGLTGSETAYTVKVKKNTTPTLTATASSITVASPKVATGTQTFTVTGANLTGETVSLSFASAVAGLSVDKTSIDVVDGAVNSEVTVSYKSDEDVAAASVNLTISTTGVSSIVIPVNYSSTAAITTIETVSTKTTWDWSTSGQSSTVNSPNSGEYVVFANTDGWGESFKADAIAGKASYFYYAKNSTYYTQANGLKIKTSVDGTLIVKFNNTGGGSRPYRWLAVQGTVTDYKSKDETQVTAIAPVTAGEILIESILGTTDANTKPTYTEANTMFNFFEITFIPNITVTTNKGGWTSFTPSWNATLEDGATAYIITSIDGANYSVEATAVSVMESGKGYFIKGDNAETEYIVTATSTAATPTEGNLIVGNTSATTINATSPTTTDKYVLGTATAGTYSGQSGLFKVDSSVNVAAGKAYLDTQTTVSAQYLSIAWDDDMTTTIDNFTISQFDKNATRYNLAGQKVSDSYKGIVIVNGKKYLCK